VAWLAARTFPRPFRVVSGARRRRCSDSGADYHAVVKQIVCVCGVVVEGEDDDRLWEKAQNHLGSDHPNLVGKVSREDILAQAEET
jgi:hypothetical protein